MKRTGFKKPTYAEALEKKKAKAVKKVAKKKVKKQSESFQKTSQEELLKKGNELLRELGLKNTYYYEGKDNKAKMKNIAWTIFSAFIRQRDFDKRNGRCYTCPKIVSHWSEFQASHYISRGKASTYYNELNVQGACYACNHPAIGGGRPRTFSYNLDVEYGIGTSTELYRISQQTIKDDFWHHWAKAQEYAIKLKK